MWNPRKSRERDVHQPFFTLMREKTWYIPGWLDRLLPDLTIEPPHEGEALPAPGAERHREPEPSEA